MLDCLGDLIELADHDRTHAEASGRPNATLVRLAYLTAPFDEDLAASLPTGDHGTVWFGPRRRSRRRDTRWNLVDTVLPRSPAEAAR